MILGIGTDIVSIDRITKLFNSFDKKFLNKILSAHELEKIKNIKQENISSFLSKKFASKEAFSKALGLGIGRGINFNDITIDNDITGKPFINLSENSKKFMEEYYKESLNNIQIDISISDEKYISIAFVIISKNGL